MTPFLAILDRATRLLEVQVPRTVTIPGSATPVPATIGEFRRTRMMLDSGYRWIERGRVSIRRSALAAGVSVPIAGEEIIVNGRSFRVEYDAPTNPVLITLDLISVTT